MKSFGLFRVSCVALPICAATFAATCPADAQVLPRRSLGTELIVGTAKMLESFSTDCCGPTRSWSGESYGLRILALVTEVIRVGAEAGVTYAGSIDMKWFVGTIGAEYPSRVSPYLQVGAGVQGQIGECLQDAPATSENCTTDLTAGFLGAVGVRYMLTPRIGLGIDGTIATGKNGEFRFTTRRAAVTAAIFP